LPLRWKVWGLQRDLHTERGPSPGKSRVASGSHRQETHRDRMAVHRGGGAGVRVSLRTGRIIPKPMYQRRDGIIPEQWKDGPKDTSVEDALEKTYVPSLKTFQEEILEKMGIEESRRHRKSFWY
ncbi:unnamed protein product, partial [Staurois parvus]